MATEKPIHTLVLDTGSIIKNEPSVSTLLRQSESLFTVPEVMQEIKDATTRSRVETTLKPFLHLRSPSPSSIKFVTDFARRTGDLAVLSRPDILIIALTYEIECERNGGNWRLRQSPGQKRINGAAPAKTNTAEVEGTNGTNHDEQVSAGGPVQTQERTEPVELPATQDDAQVTTEEDMLGPTQKTTVQEVTNTLAESQLGAEQHDKSADLEPGEEPTEHQPETQQDSDSDSGGWITPSNLKKRQAQDADSTTAQAPEAKVMQVGVLTTDFAMQNVILQINLNLLSPSLTRVKHLKTFILRCHACFTTTKEMSRQFCPRCGQPALTRVACSTNTKGEFKLHLKKNMQWNSRGDRYSIPKPVHGAAHGRVQGGGKGSWGNDLILAEDQKEYQRAVREEKKIKAHNLMDEDYLPSILTGDRGRAGGRVKVGAGRSVNSKKR